MRRFLWDDAVIPLERAIDALAASEADFDARAFGLWGLYGADSPALVGFCGLRQGPLFVEPELLFGLTETHWGRGLATEAAHAVVGYAFGALRLAAVGAATDVGNDRSTRVLARLGMRFTRRGVHEGLDTLFYRLPAEGWRGTRPATTGTCQTP